MATYTIELVMDSNEISDRDTIVEAFHKQISDVNGVKLVDDDGRTVTRISIEQFVYGHADIDTGKIPNEEELTEELDYDEDNAETSEVETTDEITIDEEADIRDEDNEQNEEESADSEDTGEALEADGDVLKCPECGDSGSTYTRKTKAPTNRCSDCGHEWDEDDEYDEEDKGLQWKSLGNEKQGDSCPECGSKALTGAKKGDLHCRQCQHKFSIEVLDIDGTTQ